VLQLPTTDDDVCHW